MRRFTTISEFHEFVQLPKPQHPLLSVVDVSTVTHRYGPEPTSMVFEFYSISLKRMHNVNLKYGQHSFDFNEGIMSFMAPNQVFSMAVANPAEEVEKSGWVIYLHPDFLWNTPLAKTIQQHDFWDYSLREGLFLSAREEAAMLAVILAIQQEYNSAIDRFSKPIIVSHIESLLQYADRFYHRQFLTREKANHEVLERLETLLRTYFDGNNVAERGLPTVQHVADGLQLSPKYLTNLLRVLTGQNTQQHIHAQLIAKAKEKLSTTTLTVSEIAYALGFEHAPSFSKLFKAKTSLSPLEFRASFT
ncbi:helix-turn-helix domain-containing protein [Hymenobacter negativus]|uniref:Helix-turn-helix transcriptional regulator n=1 Tax=Hymenobacter negativus TaxID=2795026 RepID=A0ABS0Q1J7_9BACT|nr:MULTISPECIES: helix-turn-helix transcriptional regulator [Bacteria]MBH8556534.1 helix-turn-helix transcriptional regulator [Hymenobacter negativus]MBH8571055.1 helix-turn-helix transcriptional regulator [Hymenobacter negativus]MBR7210792.1 helix-turn-helix transcriptional regulator [Microvirga sp. STS02]